MSKKENLRTAELNCKFCVDHGRTGKLGAFIDDGFTTYRECMTCGYQWNETYFQWLDKEYGNSKSDGTHCGNCQHIRGDRCAFYHERGWDSQGMLRRNVGTESGLDKGLGQDWDECLAQQMLGVRRTK